MVDKRDSLLGELIYDLKFSSVRALAKPLGDIISQILPAPTGPVSIVPLPTNSRHIRERGLDHTLLLAKNLAKHDKNYTVEKVLLRAKNTVQVGATKESRLEQAALAYNLNPKVKIDPTKTYLLLDDIWTTGASVQAALKKLRAFGASNIVILVLAVSGLD